MPLVQRSNPCAEGHIPLPVLRCRFETRVIAFFDLDKTLLPWNSAPRWVRFELANGKISWRQALRGWYWIGRYHLGFAEIDTIYREAIRVYAGDPETEIIERTRVFYRDQIRGLYRPGARETVRRHKDQGDRVVLLTTSSNYMSEHVCKELGLDDYLCNFYEVNDDGRFTGEAVEPLCVGEGKRVYAERYASKHGVTLADCAFYTDSMSDFPALEAVGEPVAVNPDPKLKRIARERGWRIEDWGVPT